MTQCSFCEGTLERERMDRYVRWGNRRILVRNVPVRVCRQCGEVFISPETSRQMDRIVQADPNPNEPTIELPVRDFPEPKTVRDKD